MIFELGVITKHLKTGSRETDYFPSALNVPVGVSALKKKFTRRKKNFKVKQLAASHIELFVKSAQTRRAGSSADI